MDRISESLLKEFCASYDLTGLPEDQQFEHFASYITIKRNYSGTFNTGDVTTGSGGDIGIDGIAITVNGSLVIDVESLQEAVDVAGYLDVGFIFVQAERSPSFDGAKIGTFEFGVLDFFNEAPKLPRNAEVKAMAEIMNAIYQKSPMFKRGNPTCKLYYVTTGKWTGDQNLEGRRRAAIDAIRSTGIFRDVDFIPIDADGIQKLYQQTKNSIAKDLNFPNRTVIPEVPGVSEAYLGFLPVPEFLNLLRDENGEMIGGLFYNNVRDWQDYNKVNTEIRETLESADKPRFVLMNNGITIIARRLQPTGNKLHVEDYQIVNGCQTSHVLFDNQEKIDQTVAVPVRLIGTQDEGVINAIIRATNRQTEVTQEQFFALEEFPKMLEVFFQTFPDPHKLYYERRDGQYDRMQIERTRIVTATNMIQAVGSMFLEEPHGATRNYKQLANRVSKELFVKGNKMEPFYLAAFALYRLEYLFRSGKLPAKLKPARFHILLAARLLANPDIPQFMNSRDMEKYCKKILDILWEPTESTNLIVKAANLVSDIAAGDFSRDAIRTEVFTRKVLAALGRKDEGKR